MLCPKCRTVDLTRQSMAEPKVEVDTCPQCRGLWFDARELESIMRVAAQELVVPFGAEKVAILCPRCSEFLYAFKYPQTLVTVDMCRSCRGLWLDAGEGREIKAVREKLKQAGALDEAQTGLAAGVGRLFSTAGAWFR